MLTGELQSRTSSQSASLGTGRPSAVQVQGVEGVEVDHRAGSAEEDLVSAGISRRVGVDCYLPLYRFVLRPCG
jgi:hypothetical protein